MTPTSRGAEPDGIVFDIQKFSLHDGPGIRTLVLFKGCPLRCVWCCNPESQTSAAQVVLFVRKCIRGEGYDCRECVDACPRDALDLPIGEPAAIVQEQCDACGRCVDACPSGACVQVGRLTTVDEVFARVNQDEIFYRHSGGGVTLSGGEPAAQPGFAAALAGRCRSAGIHTAMETCGHAPWEAIARILPNLDLVLFDVKHMDPEVHRALTGMGNQLVLDNARRVAATGVELVIRVPVIPGHNDSEANIRATAEFARELSAKALHLLPYHRLGAAKYQRLQLAYRLEELRAPEAAVMEGLRALAASCGIETQIGG